MLEKRQRMLDDIHRSGRNLSTYMLVKMDYRLSDCVYFRTRIMMIVFFLFHFPALDNVSQNATWVDFDSFSSSEFYSCIISPPTLFT